MKKAVGYVCFQSAITAPGAFGGDISLSDQKTKGLEMWTGIEPGFVTAMYKGMEIGIPYMNVKSLVWKEDLAKHRLSA